MRVPRHLKHPLALWIIDERKRLGLKPADVAQAVDVSEGTVRAWETARAGDTKRLPSPENVESLERLFGTPAPGRDLAGTVLDQLLQLVKTQAAEISALRRELAEDRQDASSERAALADILADLRAELLAQRPGASNGAEAPARRQGGLA